MALARRIAYNAVFNSALKVVSTVFIALFSIRLTTGYLGQAGFGEYATTLAFFALFGALSDLGLATVSTREISRSGASESKILGNVASLRLGVSLLLLLIVPFILPLFHYSGHVKWGVFLVAGALLFGQMSTFLNGIFQKRLAMDQVAMVEFLGKLIQLGTIYVAVRFDLGFIPIILAHFITLTFNASVVFFLSRRLVHFSLEFDVAFWKHILKEAWPIGVTTLITFAYFKMDTILLSFLRPSEEVGIYNVAYKIMENLIFFPAMLVGLIMPLLARTIFQNRDQFEEIANKTAKVFFLLALPLVVGTSFLAPQIVALVSGVGFEGAAAALRLLIFSLAFIFFGHYFTMLLIVGNSQRKMIRVLLFVAFFNITSNLILIPNIGYVGAALVSALTEFLVILLLGWLTKRTLGYRPHFEKLPQILFSGILMAIPIYLLRETSFVLAGGIGVSVYFGALWMTKAVTSNEILSLVSAKEEPIDPAIV